MTDFDPKEIIQMTVRGLTLDPVSNMPIIVLKTVEGECSLPIWIGIFEANAIALEIEKIEPPRPMTHDLIMNMLEAMGTVISRVVVHDLQDNTFFASIFISGNGLELEVDSRPSDAIALALRGGAPIFVTRGVLDKSKPVSVEEDLDDKDKLKRWLDNLKPEDFGNYPT